IGGTMPGFLFSGIGDPDWRLMMLAGLVCVLAILLGVSLRRRSRERPDADEASEPQQLRQDNARLDAALNNMSQGLCMFNAEEEIVVFNRRYLELYKLSPQVVKPGCTFRDLIQHRVEVGLQGVEPEAYYRRIITSVRQGETIKSVV